MPVDYREPVGCEVRLLLKASKARVMSTDVNANSLFLSPIGDILLYLGGWSIYTGSIYRDA